jgi:hypothetical protein
MVDKNVKRCFKSYLVAKQNTNTDVNKSLYYFIKCIESADLYTPLEDSELNNIIAMVKQESVDFICKKISPQHLFNVVDHSLHNQLNYCQFGNINMEVYNNEGLTPMHYAIKYGDSTFIKKCLLLGCPIDITCKNGYTLLEQACAEKDPNMIQFFVLHGADLKKHVEFRKNKTFINRGTSIDMSLMQKYILELYYWRKQNNYTIPISYLDHLEIESSLLNVDGTEIKPSEFLNALNHILHVIPEEHRRTYLTILNEELSFNKFTNKYLCPKDTLSIILYNLYPFCPPFHDVALQLDWLIRQELYYIFLISTSIEDFKNKITEKYIQSHMYPSQYIILMCKIIEPLLIIS